MSEFCAKNEKYLKLGQNHFRTRNWLIPALHPVINQQHPTKFSSSLSGTSQKYRSSQECRWGFKHKKSCHSRSLLRRICGNLRPIFSKLISHLPSLTYVILLNKKVIQHNFYIISIKKCIWWTRWIILSIYGMTQNVNSIINSNNLFW